MWLEPFLLLSDNPIQGGLLELQTFFTMHVYTYCHHQILSSGQTLKETPCKAFHSFLSRAVSGLGPWSKPGQILGSLLPFESQKLPVSKKSGKIWQKLAYIERTNLAAHKNLGQKPKWPNLGQKKWPDPLLFISKCEGYFIMQHMYV